MLGKVKHHKERKNDPKGIMVGKGVMLCANFASAPC